VRVWITGARGFVGSWLAPRLAAAGHAVACVDREVDVRDPEAVDAAVARAAPDAIVHLAALTSVARSFAEPAEVARVNFLGALHLLRAAAHRAPRARVLLVSSGEVYGPSADGRALDERAPFLPASPYARAKAAADALGAACGLDVVRARPFNHTGPGQSDAFVASGFARQIAEIEAGRRPPELSVGNLDASRDFLDVGDVADAYLRLLDPAVPRGAYNVASGEALPVRRILDELLARSTARPAVRVDAERWRPTDASLGNAERLRNATGWRPRVAIGDTLGRLLAWWREQISGSP